ncbi:MAG: DUF433 domain-containing protein [Myxococcota bacterium]
MIDLEQVELLPPAAAVVLGQSQKSVNKAFDEGPLASRGKSRVLGGQELLYLSIYADLKEAGLLKWKNELRLKLYSSLKRAVSQDVDISLADAVVVKVLAAKKSLLKQLKRLEAAKRLVTSDPEIRGGEPVIRGTRIPVYLVGELRNSGTSVEEVLEAYPTLNARKVEFAEIYARAFPRRGRRKKHPWH